MSAGVPARREDEMSSRRIRWLVSLSLFSIIGVGGFVESRGSALACAIDLAALVLAFLVPAQWIDSAADVWRHWPIVLGSIIAATLAWDAATAAVVGKRVFLGDWSVVYSSSIAFFVVLLLIHGVVVGVWGGHDARRRRQPS